MKYLTEKESIAANFEHYKTRDRLLSVIIADASQHSLWRERPIFDAIVSDPPYGVREKGRKVGKKGRKEHWILPGSEQFVYLSVNVIVPLILAQIICQKRCTIR